MSEGAPETFLDGRVKVAQPQTGFRSGLDAVMLAAAIPAEPGQTALELGAGAGTASLCLAVRIGGLSVTGIEKDESLVSLARDNAAGNGANCTFVAADIFALPAETVAVEPQLGPIGPNHDAEALAVGNHVFLIRRRRIADFGVAQFFHENDSLAIGGPVSVPGPSSVPTVYPKTPDALERSRTVPSTNIR